MTDNIFEDKTPSNPEAPADERLTALEKRMADKDEFIQRLLEEKRTMEKTFLERENTRVFEDRIKALEQAQLTERMETPPREVTPPPAPAPSVDPEKIEEMVQRSMAQREAQNQRSRNLMVVKDTLTEKLGENYTQYVKTRAAELGMSMDQLNAMAASAPQAFLTLVIPGEKTPDNVAPPATRQNTAAFAPQTNTRGNKYYSEMRKTNPSKYFTPAVQLEEFQELKRQGADKFYAS